MQTGDSHFFETIAIDAHNEGDARNEFDHARYIFEGEGASLVSIRADVWRVDDHQHALFHLGSLPDKIVGIVVPSRGVPMVIGFVPLVRLCLWERKIGGRLCRLWREKLPGK